MIIKHKLPLIFILFGILTLTSSIIGLVQGQETAGHIHIISRFFIIFFAIGSLYIFDWLKNVKLYKVHLIHYTVTTGMIMTGLWIFGHSIELHPDAYRDLFLNYTVIYLGVTAVELLYFKLLKKKFSAEKRKKIRTT